MAKNPVTDKERVKSLVDALRNAKTPDGWELLTRGKLTERTARAGTKVAKVRVLDLLHDHPQVEILLRYKRRKSNV